MIVILMHYLQPGLYVDQSCGQERSIYGEKYIAAVPDMIPGHTICHILGHKYIQYSRYA